MIAETFEAEFVHCYGCGHKFKSLWPDDATSPNRPSCPVCGSLETFPVFDATPLERAEAN